MNPGQTVRFKNIVDLDDENLTLKVLEVNDDRCLVEPIIDMVPRPTFIYLIKDLEVVEPVQWLSALPEVCEICRSFIVGVFYDAATGSLRGPWACMCHNCFTHGPGLNKLGLGAGQRYELKDGVWICTAGGEQS